MVIVFVSVGTDRSFSTNTVSGAVVKDPRRLPIGEAMGAAPATPPPAHAADGLTRPSRPLAERRRIGDVIVDLGFASRESVERAVISARGAGCTTGQALLEEGTVTPDQLARAVAERYGVEHVDLKDAVVDPAAVALVDPAVLRRYRAMPFAFADEHTLLVATADPGDVLAMDDLTMVTGYDIRRAVAKPEDVDNLLSRLDSLGTDVHETGAADEEEAPAIDLRESAEDAPVVKLVHSIIASAVGRGASDVHFDPAPGPMRVRFRVDGVVSDATTVARPMVAGLLSRIKIMADLDIAERRTPQDGRIGLTVDARYVDIRVATLPTVHGESMVMRILDKSRMALDLESLGLTTRDADCLRRSLSQTHGSLLATGPTGSGKSTTLYAALAELNKPERTLITIEDPVEYELEGVKQVQVNPKIGLSFASGLRSMMRSDPDVLMVGEIRDRETAQIAIESALTGHLVLSTLHTNDAPMSVVRLIEMGIEPFLVASGISCVVAQRLARRLCDCKEETQISAEVLRRNGFEEATGPLGAFEAVGCTRCGGTGFRGRVGLYELMEVTEEIRSLILEQHSADAIAHMAVSQGMTRLRDNALLKVRDGVTSLPEVLRALGGTA
jgi:type IV pilus assembly protein PilB